MEGGKTIQSRFISEIHNIAVLYPDMLERILTDEVLVWCLEDVLSILGTYSHYCLNLQSNFNLPEANQSPRNIYRTIFDSCKCKLKTYYDLFLTYQSIQKKRNISLNLSLDIDQFLSNVRQILGEDLNNIEMGSR